MQRLLAVVAVAAVPLLGACTMIPGFEPPAPQAELPPPVELPETAVGSSHFRVLFLAALVLLALTFVVNTLAEIIRQRLRTRYSNL